MKRALGHSNSEISHILRRPQAGWIEGKSMGMMSKRVYSKCGCVFWGMNAEGMGRGC